LPSGIWIGPGDLSTYNREKSFAATHAAIWNLAKVMLIKDEPYVAYLLNAIEKKQRDLIQYGVDVANGDTLVYRHHTSPEFNIGKFRLRLKITTKRLATESGTSDEVVAEAAGLAPSEVAFRDWYISLPRPCQPE